MNDMKMGWNHNSDRENHKHKYNNDSEMTSSSIHETTAFEIQTRDIRILPPPAQ